MKTFFYSESQYNFVDIMRKPYFYWSCIPNLSTRWSFSQILFFFTANVTVKMVTLQNHVIFK